MPSITFAPGIASSPRAFVASIDGLANGAALSSWSSTHLVFTNGTTTYDFAGVNITWVQVGLEIQIATGTIQSMTVTENGAPYLQVTGLALAATALQNAIIQEYIGNPAAVENLLLPLGWNYTGNGAADILLSTDVSSDGIPLNLSGSDTFRTNGGADHVFLGDGADKAWGGTGFDTLEGGNGADTLYGEAGNDRLYGGAQADLLVGGANADLLNGGGGGDRLNGGTAADTLIGGSGAAVDTFVFALHDGSDRIADFDLGVDRIDLPTGVAVSFTASGATNSVLHYGTFGDQILLVGVALADTAQVTII